MNDFDPHPPTTGTSRIWQRHRLVIIVVAIAIALVAWFYISKELAIERAQQTAATSRAQWVTQADAREADLVKQSLGQFGVPLAWAIRREMMAGNLDQVDQYVTDLIKLPGIEGATVARADGTVLVASDRGRVGAAFGSLYGPQRLATAQISVEQTAPGRWLLVVPVMGLNARLGTVAVDYRTPPSTPAR